MDNLKKGDIITAQEGNIRNEVLAVLEDLVFVRRVYDGSTGAPEGPQLIEDLVTYGFTKEGK